MPQNGRKNRSGGLAAFLSGQFFLAGRPAHFQAIDVPESGGQGPRPKDRLRNQLQPRTAAFGGGRTVAVASGLGRGRRSVGKPVATKGFWEIADRFLPEVGAGDCGVRSSGRTAPASAAEGLNCGNWFRYQAAGRSGGPGGGC